MNRSLNRRRASHFLATRLREFRLDRGMTQRQLADAMDVGLSTVLRAEAGRQLLDLTTRKIEKFLESQEKAA